MDFFSADKYKKAECPFMAEAPKQFMVVHQATNGRVCDTGCYNFNKGKCPSFQKMTHRPVAVVVKVQEYNANRVGNIARLKTRGMFPAPHKGRFIVSKEIKTGKCSGHSYNDSLKVAKANMDRSEDQVYDAILRTRVL